MTTSAICLRIKIRDERVGEAVSGDVASRYLQGRMQVIVDAIALRRFRVIGDSMHIHEI